MKKILWVFFLLISISCKAQTLEVGFAPTSVQGWGKLPKTSKFNASLLVKVFRYHSFIYKPGVRFNYIDSRSRLTDEYGANIYKKFTGFFFIPASFNIDLGPCFIINRYGFGFTNHSFPDRNGMASNFLLEAGVGIPVVRDVFFSIRYSHISNGYRGKINPGFDALIFAAGIKL